MPIEVLLFLGSVAGAIADPINLVLFLLAGALPRTYRRMLLAAVCAGLLLGAIFSLRLWSFWSDFGQDPLALTVESVAVRMLAALIVGHVVFGIALLVRRWMRSRRLVSG